MVEPRTPKSKIVTAVIVSAFVGGTVVATALLVWLGDWKYHSWGLDLTLRILWGCCVVAVAATLLTRLTIIGWYFRRYFRPTEQPPPDPVSGGPRRTVRAPWYKSPALSFSMTVTLVSLAGATALATAVIWVMGDVFGNDLMWLILKIIWGVFWVAAIALVLTRIGVFRLHMLKARKSEPPDGGAPQPAPPPPEPQQRSSDQLSLE